MTELLAPAGDLERLKIALLYGADAVYIGGLAFGLRANAINFNEEDMKSAIEYAHKLNKKVYVTVNILLHNKESNLLINYLKKLEELKVDAIIASDLYVITQALEKTNLEVHVSTQASTTNIETVKFYKELGVKRIVLARELNKDEINQIQKVGLDIEIFIHGAMCAGYSGRCVLSNYLTLRDANRGGCSQICRWDFDLLDEDKNIITKDKNFTFCTKDLSLINSIYDICKMGINSLKIEGRMRSTYYIATVVSCYRKIIDSYYNNCEIDLKHVKKVLDRVANRESIVQFFDGNYGAICNYYNNREEISNQDFLGEVISYDEKTNLVKIQQRNYFKKGDYVEFFGPNKVIKYQINEIFDEDMNIIDVVNHPKQIVYLKIDEEVFPQDFMRIDIDKI